MVSIVFTGGKNNENMCSLLPEPITVGYDPDSYVTTETAGSVTLNIRVFSHPMTGAPRPFTLVVNTEDGTASMFLARVILHVYHIFLIQLLLMVTMYQWQVRSYSSMQEI